MKRIYHQQYGEGTVVQISDEDNTKYDVLFDNGIQKSVKITECSEILHD